MKTKKKINFIRWIQYICISFILCTVTFQNVQANVVPKWASVSPQSFFQIEKITTNWETIETTKMIKKEETKLQVEENNTSEVEKNVNNKEIQKDKEENENHEQEKVPEFRDIDTSLDKLINFWKSSDAILKNQTKKKKSNLLPIEFVEPLTREDISNLNNISNFQHNSDHSHTHIHEDDHEHLSGPTGEEIKRYGWFKWYQQKIITDVLNDREIVESLDQTLATLELDKITKGLDKITNQLTSLKWRKEDLAQKYRQLFIAIRLTKNSLDQNKKEIGERLIRITWLEKKVTQQKTLIDELEPDVKQAEKDLDTYLKIFYKMQHEILQGSKVDNIKLIWKSDNIAVSLASDLLTKQLTQQLQKFIKRLGVVKTTYNLQQRKYERDLTDLQNEIDEYKAQKPILDQQIAHLQEFVDIITKDQVYIDTKVDELETSKDELAKSNSIIDLIQKADWIQDLSDIKKKLIEKKKDESTFFSFPMNEVLKITSFFEDEGYIEHFNTSHYALDFRLKQGSYVYAPAPWYVYKVVDQDSPRLNWFVLLHQQNFATIYLHMQDTFIEPWTYVKTGDILGLSWWTPWTRWAWLMTTGPHLHWEVRKDGEIVDPLLYTDLSQIPSANMLQQRHKKKWEKDNTKNDR